MLKPRSSWRLSHTVPPTMTPYVVSPVPVLVRLPCCLSILPGSRCTLHGFQSPRIACLCLWGWGFPLLALWASTNLCRAPSACQALYWAFTGVNKMALALWREVLYVWMCVPMGWGTLEGRDVPRPPLYPPAHKSGWSILVEGVRHKPKLLREPRGVQIQLLGRV